MEEMISTASFYRNPHVCFNVEMGEIYEEEARVTRESSLSAVVEEMGGCGQNCICQKCRKKGFTQNMVLKSKEKVLFDGPVMIRQPVSNHYKMVGNVSINYANFHSCDIKDIDKLKCTFLDSPAGLRKIAVSMRGSGKKEEVTVNSNDLAEWFFSLVRAKLFSTHKFGVFDQKFEKSMLGWIWVKNSKGGWRRTAAEITDRLRVEDEKEIRQIRQFWTRFEFIDVEGLCLVFKFWDFFTKWEIGLPLKDLSVWCGAFISLVKD